MIAYEDLVAALSSWRAGQGLPSNAVSFLSTQSGSVDLALPLAEPVDALATGELEALDDDMLDADELAAEEYPANDYHSEEANGGFEVEEEQEAESYQAADSMDESSADADALNYDDYESEQTAIASDFADATAFGADKPIEPAPLAAAEGEGEVEMNMEDEIAADDLPVEEYEASAASHDVRTEEVDALGDDFDGPDSESEGPTQFGDIERESTSMGIGIGELQRPGPAKDHED